MTQTDERTALVAFLVRTAEMCHVAVAEHSGASTRDLRFRRHVVPALAALRTLIGNPALEDADIRFARNVCSDAAAACRTEVPNASTVAVAVALENVIVACNATLAGGPILAEPRWERFLFKDADVAVRRPVPRRWMIRTANGTETEDTFLDVALDRALSPSPRRLAELTVQIMAWFDAAA